MLVKRLVNFKKVTQPESRKHSKCHAEEEKVTEIKRHLSNDFKSELNNKYVNYPPVSSSFRFEIVPKRIIATASLIMPSPKSTALRTGNFSGLVTSKYLP